MYSDSDHYALIDLSVSDLIKFVVVKVEIADRSLNHVDYHACSVLQGAPKVMMNNHFSECCCMWYVFDVGLVISFSCFLKGW